MKKRMAMIVFSLFFLCSCSPNTGQSGSSSQTEPPIASIPETSTGTIEVLAPYSDVRGFDEVNTLRSGEYVPADMITYWFNQNTLFEGNEALAAEIMETGKNPGDWMSTVRPHSNRERRRSSSVSISFGGLSEEIIICFLDSYNALNVWKNSSCVLSLPIMN